MRGRTSKIWKSVFIAIVTLLLCFVMCFSFAACGSGSAPYIGDNGNWFVNGEDTGVSATGPAGQDGADGQDGAPGAPGAPGANGAPGADGQDGEDGKDANATPPGIPGDSAVSDKTYDDTYTASADITEGKYVSPGMNGNFQHEGKFYTDYDNIDEAKAAAREVAIRIAAEGDVLLKNENDALPLSKDETKFTLLGIRSARMVRSGFGSGSGGGSAISTLLGDSLENAGYSVNRKVLDMYTNQVTQMREDNITEPDPDEYGQSIISTYNAYNDAAIITLSRTGAENYDIAMHDAPGHSDPDDHGLQLMDNEAKLIKHAKKYFDKVIVLINSSNILQIPELAEPKTDDNYGVDAILWVGGVGQYGAEAIPYLLNGTVSPSGHTVDVWEKDFTKSPVWTNFGLNSQNKDKSGVRQNTFFYTEDGEMTQFANLEYREGIYSGFRFYETAYADAVGDEAKKEAYSNVLYPFGYGLSYSTFEWRLDNVDTTGDIKSANDTITVRAWVKNTGDVAARDVVQVYYTPEYYKGGIEKSAANLIGFAKTDVLQPGQAQVVTVKFVAQEMASFDWNDANKNGFTGYELEAGDYVISLRTNSHEVKQGYIDDGAELAPLQITRTIAEDTSAANDAKGAGATGILCKTDLVSENEIKPVFTGDFTTVNDSLKEHMISRSTGLKQPDYATIEDRTLTDEVYADYLSQDTYFSYQDEETDPWYVKNTGIPSSWTQATDNTKALEITLGEMSAVPYVEPTIVNGEVKFPEMSDEQKANNEKWEKFMNQFTWDELVSLPANPDSAPARVGFTKYGDPDGPINAGGVQFPSNPILAATFNQELAYDAGNMVGNLLLLNGSRGWRGGGSDIHRSPFSGRNFEYYSEDGMMSALIGMNVAKGVTEKGIIAHWKHFFGNDQEYYRADYGGVFTWATEQTLREITAKPFEYIIKYGGVQGLMTAFNRLGKWTQTTNYATHELLLNQEWNFQGSTECDAWAKQYVPANLMVRGGDDSLLTKDSSYATNAIERGRWDATARNGKGNIFVAKDAEEYTTYDSGVGSLESATHYYSVRKCAQRLLQTYANNSTNNNGFLGTNVVEYTLTKGVYTSFSLTIPGETTDVNFSFADDVVWPDGMSYDASTGILSGTPTGTGADVSGTFTADSWVKNGNVTFKFNFISDLTLNGTAMTDGQKVNAKIGQAYNATITATNYSYGNQLMMNTRRGASNQRIMNAYRNKNDNQWYHRDEDKSAADIITLGDISNADMEHSNIYGYTVTGLEGSGLTVTLNETDEMGWAQRSTYKVNTSVTISGTPTKAGEYTVTVELKVPYVSKSTNPWMRAGGNNITYTQTFTIVVAA